MVHIQATSLAFPNNMAPKLVISLITFLFSFVLSVHALGSSCTVPLGAGTAAAGDPFWLQTIKHQGTAAFNSNPSTYQVFRNVKVCASMNIVISLCLNGLLGLRCKG